MNTSKSVEFFHIEMASRTDAALDQLDHVITLHSPVLENLNRLTGILRCNRCIQWTCTWRVYLQDRCLSTCVYTFVYKMMSRLIAKGIIRSYSIRQRRIGGAVKPPIGIVSNCYVCGGHERCLFCTFNYSVSL